MESPETQASAPLGTRSTSLPAGPDWPTLLQTLIWMAWPIELMKMCRRRYGDPFTLQLASQGTVVLTGDPASVKQVFTGPPDTLRAGEVNDILRPFVGDASVLLLDGKRHLRHRRMLLPSFYGERMKEYGSLMQEMTESCMKRWPVGEAFALRPHMQRITLDIMLRAVFGFDDAAGLEEMRVRLERLLSPAESRMAALTLVPAFQGVLRRRWRAFLAQRDEADAHIYRLIAKRRENHAERSDVLSLMLDARDEDGRGLKDEELRDELMTLLIAGHETTATGLCWAFERILAHPEVYVRLQAELDEVCGGEPLQPAHFGALPYLDATIKEALRTRPVLPLVGRRLRGSFRLQEWELPEGTVVAPCIYLTHQDPDLYPQPDRFRPERFLDVKTDPYTWFPFGGGIRRCIGMAFALYEMKVVMATMLSRMRFELAQRAPVAVQRRMITFTPRGGTRVRGWPR